MLTFDFVNSILNYDSGTGLFTWKTTRNGRTKIGQVAGTLKEDGYYRIKINSRSYYSHRIAWLLHYGKWPSDFLDHINTNKSDNSINNLREITNNKNLQNRIKSNCQNKLKMLGVHKQKNSFIASISVDGKQIYLGSHQTAEDASKAYIKAKRELHPCGML